MKDLRTQDEIIANWKGDIDKPVVSICCITYNHEPYIEDALKGFLIQETDFPFEILIHDDASTDRTADIIRKYEAKYPRLIKPIYQVENQYSQGVKISAKFNYPRAKGEYIAICEGDDYWIDKHKIQKQYDLIAEADIDICFTNAYMQYPSGERQACFSDRPKHHRYTLSEIVRAGGGGIPTASIMTTKKLLNTLPEWFSYAPVGDYFIQILGSQRSGAIYLDDKTCVYRVQALGSWSANRSKVSEAQIEKEANAYISIFSQMHGDVLSQDDANFATANELYLLAMSCIKLKYYNLAKKLIDLSWSSYKFMSNRQIVVKHSSFFWMLLTVYLNRNK